MNAPRKGYRILEGKELVDALAVAAQYGILPPDITVDRLPKSVDVNALLKNILSPPVIPQSDS